MIRSCFFRHLVDVAVDTRKSFVISDPVWGPILLVSTNVKHDSREWTGDIYIFFCRSVLTRSFSRIMFHFRGYQAQLVPTNRIEYYIETRGAKFGIYIVSMLSIWIFIDFLRKLYLIILMFVSRVYHPHHFFSRFRIFLNRIIFSLFFFVFEISYIFWKKRCLGINQFDPSSEQIWNFCKFLLFF